MMAIASIRRVLPRLSRNDGGATAVEFAGVAMALILGTLIVIEIGRMMWVRNSLQTVAETTARCWAINGTSCVNVPAYAVSEADKLGITLTAADVTTADDDACGTGSAIFRKVTVIQVFQPVAPFLGTWTLTGESCYPKYPS